MTHSEGLVLRAGTVFTGRRELRPGWVGVRGAQVDMVGTGPTPPDLTVLDLGDRLLAPGFVDIHVHGGAGAQVNGDSPEQVRRSVATLARFHVRHGTTSLLATTVSDSPERLLAAVRGVTDAAQAYAEGSARVLGVHLEGPWLAAGKAGAQDPSQLRPPTTTELQALLAAGSDTIRLLTIAPELPGARGVIGTAVDAGVVVSVGHTEADEKTVAAAFDAGARHVTHLFNAMPGLHHRRPGPVGAALADARVSVEVIADGVHLHPSVLALVCAAAGGRVVAVTDAMAATGLGPGRYQLGRLDVVVDDGRVILADHEQTLAGSLLTMERAVATLVAAGVSLPAAIGAATSAPADVIGEHCKGRLERGSDADLVVLTPDLSVAATMVAGRPAYDPDNLLRAAVEPTGRR